VPKKEKAEPVKREVSIPIKKQTRDNIHALNQQVVEIKQALAIAEQRLLDSIRPLLTEAELQEAVPIRVTDEEPYALIVEVTK